jgi:hypothetical protein
VLVIIWLSDWRGSYGPLALREWCRRHFVPDKHDSLYIITDAPNWGFGEVKNCGPVAEVGRALKTQRPELSKEDVLNCAGWFPLQEYVTRERLAVTFKEKGYDSTLWECTKTPEGLICR